jgi:hypothetical protein
MKGYFVLVKNIQDILKNSLQHTNQRLSKYLRKNAKQLFTSKLVQEGIIIR